MNGDRDTPQLEITNNNNDNYYDNLNSAINHQYMKTLNEMNNPYRNTGELDDDECTGGVTYGCD